MTPSGCAVFESAGVSGVEAALSSGELLGAAEVVVGSVVEAAFMGVSWVLPVVLPMVSPLLKLATPV